MMRWYPSKVDWWLIPLLCLPPLAAVAVTGAAVAAGQLQGLLIAVIVALLVVGIYVGLVFPMRYGIDDMHLLIRFGLCRKRVPLADIREVYPTRNPLSSPALSLDRLQVRYGEGLFGAVMISPADRDGFLDELARKAGLARDGDRLVRGGEGRG